MSIPIPEKTTPLSFVGTYSPAEFQILKEGFRPQGMEGKWLISYKEPWLFFRRSWTGYYVYGVRFCEQGADFAVAECWSNADGAQFRSAGIQHDEAMVKFMIEGYLLDRPVPFPTHPDIPPEKMGLYGWHVLGDERPHSKFYD